MALTGLESLLEIAMGLGVATKSIRTGLVDYSFESWREISNRERKCADTIGTVLVPWAGHFQC